MKFLIAACLLTCILSCHNNSEADNSSTDSAKVENSIPIVGNDFDSLKKYSYMLIPYYKGNFDGTATGFFIKKKGTYYLISNYHVFTNQNTWIKALNEDPYDTLLLRHILPGHIGFSFDTIDVTQVRKESKSYYFYEYPDVYVYKAKFLSGRIPVNSLEDFIVDEIPKEYNPSQVYIYGYPEESYEASPTPLSGSIVNTYHSPFVIDKRYYGREITLNNYFLTKPGSRSGFSGAPVFLKYDTPINGKSIIFGGILSGHYYMLNGDTVSTILKQPEILKRLN